MRRFGLLLMIVGWTCLAVSVGNAGCVTADQCAVYTDWQRFVALDQVARLTGGLQSGQSMRLMKAMVDEGSMVLVPNLIAGVDVSGLPTLW
jgi:hypothetical protein